MIYNDGEKTIHQRSNNSLPGFLDQPFSSVVPTLVVGGLAPRYRGFSNFFDTQTDNKNEKTEINKNE